jgi:hypothetical protein
MARKSTRGTRPHRPCKSVGQKRPFAPEQVQLIKRTLDVDGNLRDLALFSTAIDTMLRSIDLLRLTGCLQLAAGGRDLRVRVHVHQADCLNADATISRYPNPMEYVRLERKRRERDETAPRSRGQPLPHWLPEWPRSSAPSAFTMHTCRAATLSAPAV